MCDPTVCPRGDQLETESKLHFLSPNMVGKFVAWVLQMTTVKGMFDSAGCTKQVGHASQQGADAMKPEDLQGCG